MVRETCVGHVLPPFSRPQLSLVDAGRCCVLLLLLLLLVVIVIVVVIVRAMMMASSQEFATKRC
jgi:hypothetical protein